MAVIQGLDQAWSANGVRWLQGIVDRISMLAMRGNHSVATFVNGYPSLFAVGEPSALALGPGHDVGEVAVELVADEACACRDRACALTVERKLDALLDDMTAPPRSNATRTIHLGIFIGYTPTL